MTSSRHRTLHDFITHRMRMSHVYQPVMLMTLLSEGGKATTESIAKSILLHDQSQLEYYQQITNNMVGRVLREHGLVTKEPRQSLYELDGFDELTEDEIQMLIDICETKLQEYVEARGSAIWEHRRRNHRPISGTIRYEVLRRARFRCELCGISAEEKALEVDHIIPRNHNGSDDLSNFQALCYSCNASKRDRDDTDLRTIRASYEHREDGCIFCELPVDRHIIAENELAYAIRDGFPVTEGHSLVIPKRHVSSYFELGQAEMNAISSLLGRLRDSIRTDDDSVTGFNVGVNDGADAGQTIFHVHVHLMPRRKDDVENPRGGVRHTIPGKGHY